MNMKLTRRELPKTCRRAACIAGVFAVGWGYPVTQGAEPARLDRDNLLIYRNGPGEVLPVKSMNDWQKRRASILVGMQKIMGPLPSIAALTCAVS
jgi:hypothetical protein